MSRQKPRDLPKLIELVDALIKSANLVQASTLLNELDLKQVPREFSTPLSHLFWRCGNAFSGLKLLHPWVKQVQNATDQEKLQYALCLTKTGASSEAFQLLDKVTVRHATWYFAMAAVHINRWNYRKAKEHLENYIRCSELTDYERLVGKVNILAALVFERDADQCESLYTEILNNLDKTQHAFLRSKTKEIYAQLLLTQRELRQTKVLLHELESELETSSELDQFHWSKWKAIVRFVENPGASTQEKLDKLRQAALQHKLWEAVRQIDYWKAHVHHDKSLMTHLYFGTPFESFRQWMTKDFAGLWSPPKSYEWKHGSYREALLDLKRGNVGESTLRPGGLPHKLLVALCSDFYRPLQLASLNRILYPGELFNPDTTPDKIHQVKRQLNQWLVKALPLTKIRETGNDYHFVPKNCVITLSADTQCDPFLLQLQLLNETLGDRYFTIQEVMKFLGTSRSSASRTLAQAIEHSQIVKEGKGPATRYRFVA